MIDVIPGILETTWPPIEEKLLLAAPHVEWVQIDIMDNTLVPNTTFLDFAKFSPGNLRHELEHLSFEAHLMVAKPETYITTLADNGFKRLIAHVEAHDPRVFLEAAKYEHVEVGIAIDRPTEFDQVEPYLEEVDVVLVMTIEAGFSGQAFMTETLEKIKLIHQNFPDLAIEVDGGINDKTGTIAVEAGATRLVANSYLFKSQSGIAAAIESLKNG